ncbi:DUF1295 domain protein [Rutstroemia sp. NJR-2017a WRK4]|nr:DUF1295 domain protein [Rutstroemia sp. NJR-2017a WRK4]
MAEQDTLSSHFGGNRIPTEKVPSLTSGMRAEQDTYRSYFGDHSFPTGKMVPPRAEQETFGSAFGGNRIPTEKMVPPRAEQETFDSAFGGHPISTEKPSKFSLSSLGKASTSNTSHSGAEQDRYGSHFIPPWNPQVNATAIGLLQRSFLPAIASNTSLSLISYTIARLTNRLELKDYLWPLGPLVASWTAALQRQNFDVSRTWSSLAYPQKLILAGLTAWSLRLFYRIASRSYARGEDDPRYTGMKEEPGFWNKSLFSMFLPEALVQSVISLPFTMSLAAPEILIATSPLPGNPGWQIAGAAGVFFFAAGYALEVSADSQLESHKQSGDSGLLREGVWSIVRHPNYLGDALIHASFPLVLYGAGLFHPLMLLAPAANYAFLRFVGGDKENEETQEERYSKTDGAKYAQFQQYKSEKNSFWPSPDELQNKWLWIIAGIGAGGVALERGLREFL